MGCFHKSPGQVFIAALAIVAPLLFAVGQAFGVHAARVTSEVTRTGKAVNIPGFQGDR